MARKASSGSNLGFCLPPKPPPGSGANTRTLVSGSSNRSAIIRCSRYGCCTGLQKVRPSLSAAAMAPWGSIAKWVTIGKV
jgi:hypothetical protein